MKLTVEITEESISQNIFHSTYIHCTVLTKFSSDDDENSCFTAYIALRIHYAADRFWRLFSMSLGQFQKILFHMNLCDM